MRLVRAASLKRSSSGVHSRPVERPGEVLALAPRHVLVREPLLGRREVAVELPLDHRLEVDEQSLVRDVVGESSHGAQPDTRGKSSTYVLSKSGRDPVPRITVDATTPGRCER